MTLETAKKAVDFVVNNYYKFRLREEGKRACAKMAEIIKKQEKNPYHIVLDYMAIGNSIKNFILVNGKEFEKKPYESFINFVRRSAKYADSVNAKGIEKPLYVDGFKNFKFEE